MSWIELLSNKLAIEKLYGESLLLSDLEVYAVKLDMDRASIFLRVRTTKIPERMPRRWPIEVTMVSFELRAQLLKKISISFPVTGVDKRTDVRQGVESIIIQASYENTLIDIEAGDLTVGEFTPF